MSQARELKVLEDENARLKRLLADAVLDNAVRGKPPGIAESPLHRQSDAAQSQVPLKRGSVPASRTKYSGARS